MTGVGLINLIEGLQESMTLLAKRDQINLAPVKRIIHGFDVLLFPRWTQADAEAYYTSLMQTPSYQALHTMRSTSETHHCQAEIGEAVLRSCRYFGESHFVYWTTP